MGAIRWVLLLGIIISLSCQRHFGEYINAPNYDYYQLMQAPDSLMINEAIITLQGQLLLDKMPTFGSQTSNNRMQVAWQLEGPAEMVKQFSPQWLWLVCENHVSVIPIQKLWGVKKVQNICSCNDIAYLIMAFLYKGQVFLVRSAPLVVTCVY